MIATPVPENKNDFSLMLLNDGQDMEALRVKAVVDSLYRKEAIEPLIVVGVDAFDRKQEYGVGEWRMQQATGRLLQNTPLF